MLRKQVGRSHDDLGSIGGEEVSLLLRHLVRNRANDAIPANRADHGEANPGVSRGRLDNRPTGSEKAGLLGCVDHRNGDSLFDGSAGVHVLDLGHQIARGMETAETNQRGVANRGNNVVEDLHGGWRLGPSGWRRIGGAS